MCRPQIVRTEGLFCLPLQKQSVLFAPTPTAREAASVAITGAGTALHNAVLEYMGHLGVGSPGDDAGVVLGQLLLAPLRRPRRRRQRRALHRREQRELGVPVLDAELDRRPREVARRRRLRQLHSEPPPEEHPPVREVPAVGLAGDEHPCKSGDLGTGAVPWAEARRCLGLFAYGVGAYGGIRGEEAWE
jgi:hypothetical protein